LSGIVGYIGKRKAKPILLDCLERLDYRGYDSAGLAISDLAHIQMRKTEGRIKDLRDLLLLEPMEPGVLGIGHTRWATHGSPSSVNAHPLGGCTDQFVVAHNGIIENYPRLKQELVKNGHTFTTDTDTEVIPHLLEENNTGNFEETVRKVLPLLKGSYALAIMSASHPNQIIAVSQDNPFVIGFGKGETFLTSDILALLSYTREFYPIKNGEIALLTPDKVTIKTCCGEILSPNHITAAYDPQDIMLQDYDHFMLKEIFEQPKAVEETLKERLSEVGVRLPELEEVLTDERLRNIRKIDIVASGTSYHSGMIGKKVMDQLLEIPVSVSYSSDFHDEHPPLSENNLVIFLSQSGETADTLSALREAKRHGCTVIAVTNTPGSTITRKADCTILTKAGPEMAVASTKSYTAQITLLMVLTIWLSGKTGSAQQERIPELLRSLARLKQDVESTLIMTQDAIDQFAQVTFDQDHLFLIGRGFDYVLALEGALKLQEVAYIHADAYAAGEMKHGTMALITPGVPVIALATQAHVLDKTISNIKEVKAREAFVIGITTVDDELVESVVDEVMYIPSTHPFLMPILAAIPLQLLAYYSGTVRGHDVDRPRNLAKSLTVE
jgi:glutamine---fructose-6-phosphate transaminase (isomerizing)